VLKGERTAGAADMKPIFDIDGQTVAQPFAHG
jgi:hypothetical protein